MIDFFHDEFFTSSKQEKHDFVKTRFWGRDNVIQHPNFSFDPRTGAGYAQSIEMEIEYEEPTKLQRPVWGNNVPIMPNELYHQKLRTRRAVDIAFLRDFIEGCIDFFALNAFPDETLWYATGYWSIKGRRNQFMGIGIKTLERCNQAIDGDKIAFCLANRDSIVVIHGNLRKPKAFNSYIDIYATNAFLPFTEIVDIYRSGTRRLHDVESLKTEFVPESALHSNYSPKCLFPLHPSAFVMMESCPIFAATENPCKRSAPPLGSLSLVIGSIMGGFKEDNSVDPKRRFRLRVSQWKLDGVTIFEFFFIPFQARSILRRLINEFKKDTNLSYV